MTNLAIQTENLRKDYPGLTAVHSLNLSVSKGVVHGFLGPNGAGKSTTIRMMCGLLRPTSGRVLLEGFDPVENPFEIKSRVGLLPENPPLYREMTVSEYLLFTARLHAVEKSKVKGHVEMALEATQTTHVAHRLIGNLSKGYRQRVGIAQALVHDPALVILDEPTAGLDPESVVEVRALIKELKQTKTVIFSSHLLHEVEEVCDTISIIAKGELMAHGALSEVRKNFQGQGHLDVDVKTLSHLQKSHLEALPYVSQVKLEERDGFARLNVLLNTREDVRADFLRTLVQQEVDVLRFEHRGAELEDIFLKVTGLKEKA